MTALFFYKKHSKFTCTSETIFFLWFYVWKEFPLFPSYLTFLSLVYTYRHVYDTVRGMILCLVRCEDIYWINACVCYYCGWPWFFGSGLLPAQLQMGHMLNHLFITSRLLIDQMCFGKTSTRFSELILGIKHILTRLQTVTENKDPQDCLGIKTIQKS